ncbi:MAG: class I SAM-dependent DNA methyltransferase, partial [Flavobacterium sp.]
LKALRKNKDETLEFFDWKLDFPEVMNDKVTKEAGFDIVIGNPPYLNFKMYSSEERELLKKVYPQIFDGKADIYYYFFICALRLSRQHAFNSFITSRYWIEAEFASKLRKYLVDSATLIELVDFKNVTVFDGIGIKTGITSFRTNSKPDYFFFYRDHPGKKIDTVNLDDFKTITIPKKNIQKNNWVLKNDEGSSLIEKIETNSILLSAIANCKQGIVTGLDKAFITTTNEFKTLPKHIRKPWLKVGDIHRYQIIPVEKRELIYTNDIKNLNEYPILKARLQPFKLKLSNRREAANGKIRWFDLQWAREAKIFDSEKLICRFKASQNTFCYDDKGYYSSADTTVVSLKDNVNDVDLKYVLVLLNSKLLDFYFKSYGKLMDYRYEYYPGPVGNLKVKKTNNQKPYIELVDKILDYKSKGKSTEELEARVDLLVYKLYNLSYAEASLIEGGTDWMSESEYQNSSTEKASNPV